MSNFNDLNMSQQEEVILVNESDIRLGTMEKIEAHRKALLHRAFSVFIFNSKGEMLLQQRAPHKYHSPSLWTNACCSHPRPDEDTSVAAQRRLKEELGFATPLVKIFDFIYRTEYINGLTEFEFDHVYTGIYDGIVVPNEEEITSYRYDNLGNIEAALTATPEQFTSWFILAFPMVLKNFSLPETIL